MVLATFSQIWLSYILESIELYKYVGIVHTGIIQRNSTENSNKVVILEIGSFDTFYLGTNKS